MYMKKHDYPGIPLVSHYPNLGMEFFIKNTKESTKTISAELKLSYPMNSRNAIEADINFLIEGEKTKTSKQMHASSNRVCTHISV